MERWTSFDPNKKRLAMIMLARRANTYAAVKGLRQWTSGLPGEVVVYGGFVYPHAFEVASEETQNMVIAAMENMMGEEVFNLQADMIEAMLAEK
jgi:hypothetical protein